MLDVSTPLTEVVAKPREVRSVLNYDKESVVIVNRDSVNIVRSTVLNAVQNTNTTVTIISAGEQGPAGVDGDKTFEYTQNSAATVWDVTHNLNKFPAVSVTDTALSLVYADIRYYDANRVVLTFSAATSGKAFFN